MSMLAFLFIQTANNFIMYQIDRFSYWIPDLEGQISLTLHCHLFSHWGKERVSSYLSYVGGQYIIHECHQPIATQIMEDSRPEIYDTLLTLIFNMGYVACLSSLWWERRPVYATK